GDEPARILEIISPAGFERYFVEIAELVKDGPPDERLLGELLGRYGFEVDPASIPQLVQEHGLAFPG
ncbi:MAG: cupin domain-containing protein, partial [Thermoleophilaceae bacterium]